MASRAGRQTSGQRLATAEAAMCHLPLKPCRARARRKAASRSKRERRGTTRPTPVVPEGRPQLGFAGGHEGTPSSVLVLLPGEELCTVAGFVAGLSACHHTAHDLAAENPLTRLRAWEVFPKNFPKSAFVAEPVAEPGPRTREVMTQCTSKKTSGVLLGLPQR